MLIQSQVIAAGSGSAGGLTLSRNRSGMYFRARAVPVNPSSSQQQQVRNTVLELVTAWVETLTQAQRDAWDTYAANVPLINPLGAQINVTGQNMYIRSNIVRLQASAALLGIALPRVDNAPTIFDTGTFTIPGVTFTGGMPGTIDVAYDAGDAWANEDDSAMVVFASREFNASRTFFKGPFRIHSAVLGDATTPPVPPQSASAPFNYTAANQASVQIIVTRADGRVSNPIRIRGVIA